MTAHTLNDILQLAGVAIALAISVIYIVRRIIRRRKRSDGCAKDCDGCPLSSKCNHGSGTSCGCN